MKVLKHDTKTLVITYNMRMNDMEKYILVNEYKGQSIIWVKVINSFTLVLSFE